MDNKNQLSLAPLVALAIFLSYPRPIGRAEGPPGGPPALKGDQRPPPGQEPPTLSPVTSPKVPEVVPSPSELPKGSSVRPDSLPKAPPDIDIPPPRSNTAVETQATASQTTAEVPAESPTATATAAMPTQTPTQTQTQTQTQTAASLKTVTATEVRKIKAPVREAPETYFYRDEEGNTKTADSLSEVPEKYRSKAKKIKHY